MLWSKYSQKCCNLFDDVKRIVKKKVAKIIIKKIVEVVWQIFLFIVQSMIESSERPAVRYAREEMGIIYISSYFILRTWGPAPHPTGGI